MGVISKVYTLVQQICASVQSGIKEKGHVVAIRLFFPKMIYFIWQLCGRCYYHMRLQP